MSMSFFLTDLGRSLIEAGHQAVAIAREHGQLSDLAVRFGPRVLSLVLQSTDCGPVKWGIEALALGLR